MTVEFAEILEVAKKPHITGLDFSAFGKGDILNTILQRSEVLFDQDRPGQFIRAWTKGDTGPLSDVVDKMGLEVLERAAAVHYIEYQELKPVLLERNPKRIADIGCGYAMFDLFAAKDTDADLVLIDLEESESKHFGFQEAGAAYSNLDVAKKFLQSNDVPAKRIRTINPSKTDVSKIKGIDLAVSFLSCGFHYPLSTYGDFFGKVLGGGGAVIVDVRQTQGSGKNEELSAMGDLRDISVFDKRRRVLVT